MRILFCDDDPQISLQLQKLVLSYFQQIGVKTPDCAAYTSGEALLQAESRADIAFLDVEMPGISGIYVGARLKERNPYIKIIILTSYADYLDEAMRFQVFRYLSKPVDKNRLFRNLKDALYQYNMDTREYPIETADAIYIRRAEEIVCVEATSRKTLVYTSDQTFSCTKNMEYWRKNLTLPCFYCPHRSYIVNMRFISSISKDSIFLRYRANEKTAKMAEENMSIQLSLQRDQADRLYYESLQKQYNSQRILIHDIRNHLQVIDAFAHHQQTEKISEYILSMDATLRPPEQISLCDHPILNALLLNFQKQCLNENVAFSCDIRAETLQFMDPTSMTALFGNLLSNALEAAAESQERQIELCVRRIHEQNGIVVSVENSCDRPPVANGFGGYISKKKNSACHGIGLKSIERVVKKYAGTQTMHYDPAAHTFHGYEVDAGLVDYHYLAHSDTKKLLTENSVRNLFVKHPTFSYQKEFHIAVTKQLYKPGEPPVDSITYHFPHGLSPDKAQMIPVSHLKQEGHDYIIQLSK